MQGFITTKQATCIKHACIQVPKHLVWLVVLGLTAL